MKMPCTWSALETGGILEDTVPLDSYLVKSQLLLVCMVQAGFKSTQRDAWIQDTSKKKKIYIYVYVSLLLLCCLMKHIKLYSNCGACWKGGTGKLSWTSERGA